MTVRPPGKTSGVGASQPHAAADRILACPWRGSNPHSCPEPGAKPGASTNSATGACGARRPALARHWSPELPVIGPLPCRPSLRQGAESFFHHRPLSVRWRTPYLLCLRFRSTRHDPQYDVCTLPTRGADMTESAATTLSPEEAEDGVPDEAAPDEVAPDE